MYSMNYIGKFISNFRDFYNEINAATLTGAIDVVVVEQPDGSFTCSPFHVRFGKLGVLRSREKIVDIEINGDPRQIHMKLGESGEAFFVEEVSSSGCPLDSEIPPHLACSPIPDDSCFPPVRFNLLSELPQEQHEKILRDSVLSIEREKWEQMSALPPDQREKFLVEQFSDLPLELREKWLQIASMTSEERDKMFKEYYESISTTQKQQMIREQYSALKNEDKERLFKENFPELPTEQRENFEKALLTDWQEPKWETKANLIKNDNNDEDEEIFDMDGLDGEPTSIPVSTPKSFIAVTSTDRIRKISVVNNDFRPIIDDPQSSSKEKSSDESNTSLTKKISKDESIDDTKGGKRKRKRRSVMKKKNSQRKASNGSSSQAEMSESDNLVVEESPNDISKSSSTEIDNSENSISTVLATFKTETTTILPETDFHFFSDTEVTKNRDSRPCSPVQSDSEFEVRKISLETTDLDGDKSHQSWRWGELPSPPPDSAYNSHKNSIINSTVQSSQNNDKARRSMLSGMFSFMKKTSRVRHNPESEGIYLSDIKADELDPEVAALYFPSSHRGPSVVKEGKTLDEEDAESGNGPSLPQSPNSFEGVIGGPKSLDSDFEEPKNSLFENIDVSLSLCGGLESEHGPSDIAFHQNQLQFEDLCADPKLYENPNLTVKINGKYYNWTTACPIIMTLAVFQRQLPQSAVEVLYSQYMPILMHDDKKMENETKPEGRSSYSSWFSWRRSTQPPKKSQEISQDETDALTEQDNIEAKEETVLDETDKPNEEKIKTAEPVQVIITTGDDKIEATVNIPDTHKEISVVKTEKENEKEGESYSGSEDSDSNQNKTPGIKIPMERRPYYEATEKYRKTLRLSSEQIVTLNLKEGPNEVVFSVTTAYQGTTRCKCHIYRWRWDDKIVISDIDGTITKSDVLGHILPIVGKDWAQSGVAQLFTKIKNNGYKLLYLSARAIGQARVTREYLKSIKQGDLSLPEGPLLLNPTSLISAFHREVIEKKPEEFKISCLSDIQALFPEDSKPFYAGYGNRINDVWAYRAVGIPIMRIFTINHRGELKHELTQTFQSSYSNMSFIVDHLFPAFREDAADEFSQFAYWREPITEMNLDSLVTDSQSTSKIASPSSTSTSSKK
ncbi:phosphatidate phosphatase LPIN1 isoform X2 [Leptopilina heterotoma]|uniref:phosphatidate phosphatase LPIN1 isoform X2 n=1 Tax=Leptopilina heterotoma TaxID=63436 RepID=UPI001CAA15A7|nr:phosphatidate phosphatase LPIN1 isoform X2 [Leptopilina heterotoma]